MNLKRLILIYRKIVYWNKKKPLLYFIQMLNVTMLKVMMKQKDDYDDVTMCWVYGIQRHFQQYFSYIVEVSFIVEETVVPGENNITAASHWQTWSHNAVSRTPRHNYQLTSITTTTPLKNVQLTFYIMRQKGTVE